MTDTTSTTKPTSRTKAAKTEAPKVDILGTAKKVDVINVPLKGRGYSKETLAIREMLDASLEDREAIVVSVTQEDREDFARKIRAAGKIKNRPEIKISTRYDVATGSLVWGPAEVMAECQEKFKATASK